MHSRGLFPPLPCPYVRSALVECSDKGVLTAYAHVLSLVLGDKGAGCGPKSIVGRASMLAYGQH